jgi:hypothetical protein
MPPAYRQSRSTLGLLVSTIVVSAGLFACDCGGGAGSKSDADVDLDVCERSDAPEKCGSSCMNDSQCGDGTYCASDLECTADCAPTGSACGTLGTYCDSFGRCQLTSNGDGGTEPDACVDVDLEPERVIPNVVLLVDKSGSMEISDIEMADMVTLRRWNALRELLIGECAAPKRDPDAEFNGRQCSECTDLVPGSVGIVGETHELINYGLMIYPAGSGETLCGQRHTVPIAEQNYVPVRDMFMNTRCAGGTPTQAAFEDVMMDLYDPADPDPTIVILATDGNPNHCECRNGFSGGSCGSNICCADNQTPTQDAVVDTVETAYQVDGVATYVIAISNAIAGNAHFQELANVGQGLPRDGSGGDATLYEASEGAVLQDALRSIISSYIPCEIDLHATVQASDICKGTVILEGSTLECNGTDGFERVDDRHIRLKGDACEIWKTEPEAMLSATWPCGFVVIIPG